MITIFTEDFEQYNYQEFYSFLMRQEERHFEILFTKIGTEDEGDPFANYQMYLYAAYCGQLLHDISESFGYYVPCRNSYNSYRFEIETEDMESLAEILADMSNTYYEWKDPEKAIAFQQKASDYFMESYDETIDQATVGLIVIADYFALFCHDETNQENGEGGPEEKEAGD